jgi:hypothetical protein
LSAPILLLIPSQNIFYILVSQVGWVDKTWNCIVWGKLIHYNLLLKLLWKEYHDTVGEGVTVIYFHVALDVKLIRQVFQVQLKIHLIPVDHWWVLIVVLGCAHYLVSRV